MVEYKRGMTAKSSHAPEARPPKKSGRVANDVYPDPIRSAVMPPPTSSTQEPRMSRKTSGPSPPKPTVSLPPSAGRPKTSGGLPKGTVSKTPRGTR